MRSFLWLFVVTILAACGGPQSTAQRAIVVYASEDDPANLPELFAAFTAETSIPITALWGDSSTNADVVIGKQGAPADVLITPNVADIWRAAEQGALRPLHGDAFASVQGILKDPDGFWVALNNRLIVVVAAPQMTVKTPVAYRALASQNFNGKLCLSSINNSVNRALIAMLIEDLGLKPAERVIRGWMMNLFVPPFETEAMLVAALQTGRCEYGIVSSSANTAELTNIAAEPSYIDISAMGVGRHASNPDSAQQLIDWMIGNNQLQELPDSNGRNMGLVGWRDEDVMLLAERVGYR